MSRTEKIIAFLLATGVFFGLFFSIWSSLRNPPARSPLPAATDTMGGTDEEPFDFEEEMDTAPVAPPLDKEPVVVTPAEKSAPGTKK